MMNTTTTRTEMTRGEWNKISESVEALATEIGDADFARMINRFVMELDQSSPWSFGCDDFSEWLADVAFLEGRIAEALARLLAV